MKRFRVLIGLLYVAFFPMTCSWGQWGEVKGKQIEPVFIRNDRAGTIQAATASLTIKATDSQPGHRLLILENAEKRVLQAGLPGFLILDSTAGLRHGEESIRPIGVMEDNAEHEKPLIYYGISNSGGVHYTSEGFQTPFASDCLPAVVLIPINLQYDQGDESYLYYWALKSNSHNGFQYEILRWTYDTAAESWVRRNESVTSSVTVYWHSMGWR